MKEKELIAHLEAKIAILENDLEMAYFKNPATDRYREALEKIARYDGINDNLMQKNWYPQVAKEALK